MLFPAIRAVSGSGRVCFEGRPGHLRPLSFAFRVSKRLANASCRWNAWRSVG